VIVLVWKIVSLEAKYLAQLYAIGCKSIPNEHVV